MSTDELEPDVAALVEAWRTHRRAALKLAIQLDGWEFVAEYLNEFLTEDDAISDLRAMDPEFREKVIRSIVEQGEEEQARELELMENQQRALDELRERYPHRFN